ncbi:alpha/beta hydrolase [Rhodococcus sp. 1163]|uniref:alpha/beta hydrolase n=1 Tax=unclassified Rhodococcus (in: high G+C Gram-positive bacteria) TaxID=192944 RepID=UPI000A02863A|nr:alpha/beta hydrolase [Rhodococcus sp. 1163]ORI20011.1 alpha/beta hydrolase [Rhodococcus sp. 1163]
MRTHLGLKAGAVVAAIALLASCSQNTTPEEDAPDTGSLDKFYSQELNFETCTPPAEKAWPTMEYQCANMDVPLDYANPDGETAEIAISRIPARSADPIGSVVLNPGGPGFSGTAFAATTADAWAQSAVTDRFDLVGFDPRGVGASTPAVDCFDDEEREADAIGAAIGVLPHALSEESTSEYYAHCAAGSGGEDVLAHIGTRDVARDMDVMRAALGDDELTFAGASYGTRLGAVYAEMFPENVRALVLDGAMDPLAGTKERRLQQADGMQRAFDEIAKFCATQSDCGLGPDPGRATEVFQSLVQPLVDAPLPVTDGRELTFTKAIGGVTLGLYSQEAWPAVIMGIANLRDGRGETLLALNDLYHERAADGTYLDTLEATGAINCLDEERHTPDEESALIRAVFDASPFVDSGRPVENVRDTCEHWPIQPTLGYPYATEIEGLPDTLTVSVTGDALTPHQGGIDLADTLGGSLLTVEGEQHGAIVAKNTCVDDIVADYLIDLLTPADDARCAL